MKKCAIKVPKAGEVEYTFRRNGTGRKAVQLKLKDLLALDQEVFPGAPLFDGKGLLRMKHDGASTTSQQDILNYGPACLELMQLGLSFRTVAVMTVVPFVSLNL